MRSLTRDQLLKIFGLTSGAFDAQQRDGHVPRLEGRKAGRSGAQKACDAAAQPLTQFGPIERRVDARIQ